MGILLTMKVTCRNAHSKPITVNSQVEQIAESSSAIEAAHAGEAGKGFAAAAGEVRKLAELSGKVQNRADVMYKHSAAIHEGMEKLMEISSDVTEKVSAMRSASVNTASFLDNARRLRA